MALRYPLATWRGDGRRYGALTNRYPTCLILHTTETVGMPGYSNGNHAPHLTYHPAQNRFYQHQSFTSWVGTMRAGNGPVSNNAKALQIEIICYSDKPLADAAANRIWVGHLTDRNYADLAAVVKFLHDQGHLPSLGVYMPSTTWRYGEASPFRMSVNQFMQFSGITAHGAAPGNAHWNTGVLDIRRIAQLAGGTVTPPSPPPPVQGGDDILLPLEFGHGYATQPSGSRLSGNQTARREDVRHIQTLLHAGGFLSTTPDGVFGPNTRNAVNAATGKQIVDGTNYHVIIAKGIGTSAPPPPPPPPPPLRTHTVRQGDTLQKISNQYLGRADRWREIYDIPANRAKIGSNPNNIQPGTVLDIPNK